MLPQGGFLRKKELYRACFITKSNVYLDKVFMIGTLSQIGGRVRALDKLQEYITTQEVYRTDVPLWERVLLLDIKDAEEIVAVPYDEPFVITELRHGIPGQLFLDRMYRWDYYQPEI